MRSFPFLLLTGALLLPATACAQERPTAPPPEVQIASAVASLPEAFREGATVLGYRPDGTGPAPLREGSGAFVCLANEPGAERFHVACYHESLEPFMARGRELRAQGRGEEVDEVRNREIETGALAMPEHPAALYSLTGPADGWDPETGEVLDARPLTVLYVPFATGESTGLPTSPVQGGPWLMDAGTARAHVMFTPSMP